MADGATQRVALVVASSRVGQAAIKALLHASAEDHSGPVIRAVLRDASKADPSWHAAGVEVVSGLDLRNDESLAAAFHGVHGALIVAPQSQNRDQIVNDLMAAAEAHGVRHVVLIGGVFQDEERFLFHRQWMATRRHAQDLGLAWTQLECSDFMENLLASLSSIRTEGRMYGSFSDGVSSPVALDDIGRAAAAVLRGGPGRHGSRGYRIVGPEALTPREVAGAVGEVVGREVQFVDVGLEGSKQRALDAGRAPWQVDGFADWQQLYFATGRLRNVGSDLAELGLAPTTLRTWLKDRVTMFTCAV